MADGTTAEGTIDGGGGDVITDTRHKHLVIGAGFCGLGVSAALLRRNIPFDCVEADDEIGGNWYHGVYETAHIISSRDTTQYADYPMPRDYPDFPSAAQMLAYLKAFARDTGVRDHITFRTRVEHVRPVAGDAWEVTLSTGEVRVYAGVIIANGHHWDRRIPSYPGTFDGETLHSKDYKSPGVLAGKRVLVVGGGNSACDIAVEAARFGKSAHVSMRRGYWFMPKTVLGVPTVEIMKPWLPVAAQRVILRGILRVVVGPYERYGLQHPDHRIFEKHPTINSELLHGIRHGRIVPHRDIARFEGRDVIFEGGERETFDLVVFATGYHVSLPMLEEGVVRWRDGFPDLVNGLLPTRHKNLYTFGLSQVRYGAGPLITRGADLVATMIETQPRLAHPLGAILRRIGAKMPTTWLADPFESLRNIRRAESIVPRLPRVERFLMRGRQRARAGASIDA